MRSLQKPSYLKFRVADGAAFGFDDPCQVFRIIGSILGGGLVETGDRGQGLTGPRRFLLENFGVHVEGGVPGAARGCAEGVESPASTISQRLRGN